MRWAKCGIKRVGGYLVYFSGGETGGERRVGIAIKKELIGGGLEWEAVNGMLINNTLVQEELEINVRTGEVLASCA